MTTEPDDDWHAVCGVDDLGDEDVLQYLVDGETPVAVYNVDGEFYATSDLCTYQHASLSDGFVADDEIECPAHQCRFHIVTGEVRAGPASEDLAAYSVRVHGDTVYVLFVDEPA
ncbi:MAG: non-heme iron oxygenase ferredoxin subunit [Pseudomonadota bacterium]